MAGCFSILDFFFLLWILPSCTFLRGYFSIRFSLMLSELKRGLVLEKGVGNGLAFSLGGMGSAGLIAGGWNTVLAGVSSISISVCCLSSEKRSSVSREWEWEWQHVLWIVCIQSPLCCQPIRTCSSCVQRTPARTRGWLQKCWKSPRTTLLTVCLSRIGSGHDLFETAYETWVCTTICHYLIILLTCHNVSFPRIGDVFLWQC